MSEQKRKTKQAIIDSIKPRKRWVDSSKDLLKPSNKSKEWSSDWNSWHMEYNNEPEQENDYE